MQRLSPALILGAYSEGLFPMGDDQSDQIDWYSPDPRAIIPLDGLKISRSLRKKIEKRVFNVTYDVAFELVLTECSTRSSTWITDEIFEAYLELHELGFGHSVECWENGVLVGGLYGVSLGGAFFGESMFHNATDASKVALASLVSRMNTLGFQLLDVQFMTSHLESLGAIEISKDEYLERLEKAMAVTTEW